MFRLVRYHLGSVYYGSLMTALFEPLSFVKDITSVSDVLFSQDNSILEWIEHAKGYGGHAAILLELSDPMHLYM